MKSQIEKITTQSAPKQPAKSQPKGAEKDPKHRKPQPKLHPLHPYVGTVGEYAPNAEGVYDRFTLTTANGAAHTVKFPPHFGQALLAAAQPGQAATVLGYLHTTPRGDEHLHLARIEAAGSSLRPLPPTPPAPPTAAEAFDLHGELSEVLLDPQGHPRGLRLTGEAAELRLPPHLGQQLAQALVVGAAVQASGQRRPARPGEVQAPGTQPALPIELLTIGSESFLLK